MTVGVALGTLVTLVMSVVVLYAVTIYLSLLTSFGGGDAADPSWVDWLLRLGPPAVVVALVFGVVFAFARASGRGSVRSWVVTTALLSVPIAVLAVAMVRDPAVILPVLLWLALWTVASAFGARAGLRAAATRRTRAARSPDAAGSTP
jgi:hypothetical protein